MSVGLAPFPLATATSLPFKSKEAPSPKPSAYASPVPTSGAGNPPNPEPSFESAELAEPVSSSFPPPPLTLDSSVKIGDREAVQPSKLVEILGDVL
jgi:hypothetical protein